MTSVNASGGSFRKWMASVITLALLTLLAPVAEGAIKAGSACPKKGQVKVVTGKRYTCILSGKKLVWSKGVTIVKTSPTPTPTPSPSPTATPASYLTSPPADMTGINNHADFFSTGLDPNFVTLGPKLGNRPELPSYAGQTGLVIEVADGTPILAPIDIRFIGFNDRNSQLRIASNGVHQIPFDDLELCFESADSAWPGLIFCIYHQQNSPLLLGIDINPLCATAAEWPGPLRAEGRQFFSDADTTQPASENSRSCQALLGRLMTRGSVIGYAGSVGPHSQSPIRIKVKDKSSNPTATKGDRYLHWVQPDVFFYWKCFSPTAKFPIGVLAYPFECDSYRLPTEQQSVNFKYKA